MKVVKHICDYGNCKKDITDAKVIYNGPSLGYIHEPKLEFCSESCLFTFYQLAKIVAMHQREQKWKPKNWVGMN